MQHAIIVAQGVMCDGFQRGDKGQSSLQGSAGSGPWQSPRREVEAQLCRTGFIGT
jgi:hypothetical protein